MSAAADRGAGAGRVLVLCDPNLERAVATLVGTHLPRARRVCWRRGDRAGARALRALLRSRPWDVVFSVYSDFILREPDLRAIRIPLNVHPALPDLPGVGYDVLPLVRGHRRHGATLHRMQVAVDAGPVVETLERPLSACWDHAALRAAGQQAALTLFERWLQRAASAPSLVAFERALAEAARTAEPWSGAYVSRSALEGELAALRRRDPKRFARLGLPLELVRRVEGAGPCPGSRGPGDPVSGGAGPRRRDPPRPRPGAAGSKAPGSGP